ncbi:hypothetical protein ACHWQZ_G008217 [Mnemiopsis leidyi]
MINSGEDSSCLYIDDLDISIPKHYIAHPEDYLDFIARGSFANVYSFSDSKKKETCAIKIGKEEKDEKFTKDEIAIHRTLNHPNIVRYYLAYHCNQAKDYQQGLFKEKILRPLLKRIKSRDIRTLVKTCLVEFAPNRKSSLELLCLVKLIRSNRKPSKEVLV